MSIQRLYLKELITFDESELEFDPGLIVLTGPSGAGKSVLMQSVLSSFGYGSSEARVCEVTLTKPKNIKSEAYELDEELVIRTLKKDRTRFTSMGKIFPKKHCSLFFPQPYTTLVSGIKADLKVRRFWSFWMTP